MFYLIHKTEVLSVGQSISDNSERLLSRVKLGSQEFLQQKPGSQNIKRLLLKKTRYLSYIALFYVWKDARVWAHRNHCFDLYLSCLRPASRVSSGCAPQAGCMSDEHCGSECSQGSLRGAVMWRLGGGNILFPDKSRLCFSFRILLCFTSRDWIGGENGHTLVCFLWSFAQFCHRGLGINTIWACFLASRMIAQSLLLNVVLRYCLFLRFGFHEYFNWTMTEESKITNSLILIVN